MPLIRVSGNLVDIGDVQLRFATDEEARDFVARFVKLWLQNQ